MQSNWRVVTAVVAVVLAALAGVLVWKYADNAKKDAKKPYKSVQVLVASKRVPLGTSFTAALDTGLIKRADFVEKDAPATRIDATRNDVALKESYGKLVSSHDITIGQPIVQEDFVAQGSTVNGLAGALQTDSKADNKHYEAVTVTIDDQHAVGGFLSAGDKVNMLLTLQYFDVAVGRDPSVKTTTYLLPNMKILAVGSQTTTPVQAGGTTGTTTPVAGQSRSLITFEATSRQVEQIIHAQSVGTLYLSLNPTSFKPGDFTDPGEIVEQVNLFDKDLPTAKQVIGQLKNAK